MRDAVLRVGSLANPPTPTTMSGWNSRMMPRTMQRLRSTLIGSCRFLMILQMVNSILELKEYNRFSKGIFSWVGYNTKWLEYKNVERVAGTTKWSFWKLFLYSLESIVAFSTVPLAIACIMGILFFLVSVIMIIFIVVKTLTIGDPVAGWPSLVCIIFFVSGVQLFSIGVIGQYLSKLYLEVKARPVYIVKETEKDKKWEK